MIALINGHGFKRQLKYHLSHFENESSDSRTKRLNYQRMYKTSKVRQTNSIALNIARSEPNTEVVDNSTCNNYIDSTCEID